MMQHFSYFKNQQQKSTHLSANMTIKEGVKNTRREGQGFPLVYQSKGAKPCSPLKKMKLRAPFENVTFILFLAPFFLFQNFWYRVTQKKGACKAAKQTYLWIPNKNLTFSVQYFQGFHCQKKDICNSAAFSPTALLQISFVEIILRLPVDISLIENRISYHNQYFEGSSYIHC